MLAPGYKEVADHFKRMVKELEANPEEHGCEHYHFSSQIFLNNLRSQLAKPLTVLGMSSWLNFGDRTASNELMTLSYYRSAAHLNHFARGPSHRAGWNWWNKMVKDHPHLGTMHEVYGVPKQGWESVYINYHPTGLGKSRETLEQLRPEETEPGADCGYLC